MQISLSIVCIAAQNNTKNSQTKVLRKKHNTTTKFQVSQKYETQNCVIYGIFMRFFTLFLIFKFFDTDLGYYFFEEFNLIFFVSFIFLRLLNCSNFFSTSNKFLFE